MNWKWHIIDFLLVAGFTLIGVTMFGTLGGALAGVGAMVADILKFLWDTLQEVEA